MSTLLAFDSTFANIFLSTSYLPLPAYVGEAELIITNAMAEIHALQEMRVENIDNTIEILSNHERGPTLYIGFKRTIRVADTKEPCKLPPSMGAFPIYTSKLYADKLPEYLDKDGFFLPMYRRQRPSCRPSLDLTDYSQNVKPCGSASTHGVHSRSRSTRAASTPYLDSRSDQTCIPCSTA